MRFSVVIPTYNRPTRLLACLRSIANLDYPASEFEVLVCDDASSIPMEQATSQGEERPAVRWFRNPRNFGAASARNLGARHARGTFLAFVDDDCQVASDWLRRLEPALVGQPGCAVGGAIVLGRPENLCSAASHAVLDTVYRYYNADAARARFCSAANLALPRDRFWEVGGFDPTFRISEDRDFCARWLGHGFPLVYAADAQVVHDSPLTLREFCGRHYHYGMGGYRFRHEIANQHGDCFRFESAKFYLTMLAHPWIGTPFPRAAKIGALVALSQMASTAGLARAWWSR